MNRTILLSIALVCLFNACTKKEPALVGNSVCSSRGPVWVYKTKKDYVNNISVQLSSDGKKIIAYPGPRDAAIQRPRQLADGYLLKWMVGEAFTDITFDEYLDTNNNFDLLAHVIDRDPFSESYQCCEVVSRDTGEVNALIRSNGLGKCKRLN